MFWLSLSRKVVCKRCGNIMVDFEPCSPRGEFAHITYHLKDKKGRAYKTPKLSTCPNVGKIFTLRDAEEGKEIELFVRKSLRRRMKRHGRHGVHAVTDGH